MEIAGHDWVLSFQQRLGQVNVVVEREIIIRPT